MRRDKKPTRLIVAVAVVLMSTGMAYAQTVPDPAIEKAKEETAVVFDLGRFFGYVHGMSTEESRLALSPEQRRELFTIMTTIRKMNRVEPGWAAETLEYLELDLLRPDQLMEVDRRAIEWQKSRTINTPGTGGGAGPISSYVAGGAFNPIIDETKTIGKGFAALYSYLE